MGFVGVRSVHAVAVGEPNMFAILATLAIVYVVISLAVGAVMAGSLPSPMRNWIRVVAGITGAIFWPLFALVAVVRWLGESS